jgi:putative membrane protein
MKSAGGKIPGVESCARKFRKAGAVYSRLREAAALCLICSCLFPLTVCLAHEGKPHTPRDLLTDWGFEPFVVAGLAVSAWLYFRGVRRLWRESAAGAGIRKWEAMAYAGGWFALFIALASPLHPLGSVLFSAHMSQHEILMLVAAPLLVLGRPLVAFIWALPLRWRRKAGGAAKSSPLQSVWRAATNPLAAWAIHAFALWVWHAPALFQATLDSELVHTAQHLSFLLSALLFWWALIHGRRALMGYGAAVLYMFTTSIHSGLLGALITFSSSVWYPAYSETTTSWGLTPLEDQQLGGLIMWIPAGLVYIFAGLALFAGWLRESERRAVRRERAAGDEGPEIIMDGVGTE